MILQSLNAEPKVKRNMLDIHQIPILNDNYVYVLHETDQDVVAIVDAGEADPVIDFLDEKGWRPDYILNTHHHDDHIGGNQALVEKYGCQIIAPKGESRIHHADQRVSEGDKVSIGNSSAEVIETPGHTSHHICFWFEGDKALFCGDTLFSIGCGRVFEGTAEEMFESLSKIKDLPDDTMVYCAHEYTQKNVEFAKTVIPDNQALIAYESEVKALRERGISTIPSKLGGEKKANPFLLADTVQEFAEYRRAKDNF